MEYSDEPVITFRNEKEICLGIIRPNGSIRRTDTP
jgi:hypothetical protein